MIYKYQNMIYKYQKMIYKYKKDLLILNCLIFINVDHYKY